MKIDLSKKLVLITGASKGIGYGVAKVFTECGANIIIVSRNEENLKSAKKNLLKHLNNIKTSLNKNTNFTIPEINYIAGDLSNIKEVEQIMDNVLKIGEPDILYFSSGGPKGGFFNEKELEEFQNAVNILLYAPVIIIKKLLPSMIDKKYGKIIINTSVAIKEPIPSISLSNIVRISMAGLVKQLAKEYGKYNITTNGIMPGIIETDRVIELSKTNAKNQNISIEEAKKFFTDPIPLNRMGKPEEIGYLAAFLASKYGDYINGTMIPVDGGRLNSVF